MHTPARVNARLYGNGTGKMLAAHVSGDVDCLSIAYAKTEQRNGDAKISPKWNLAGEPIVFLVPLYTAGAYRLNPRTP